MINSKLFCYLDFSFIYIHEKCMKTKNIFKAIKGLLLKLIKNIFLCLYKNREYLLKKFLYFFCMHKNG